MKTVEPSPPTRLVLFTAKELARRFRARGIRLNPRYPDCGLGTASARGLVSAQEVRAFWRLKDDVVRTMSHPLWNWPERIGRAKRRLVEFTTCADCAADPPVDDIVRVGRKKIQVPGQTGTRVAYGDVSVCQRHALGRARP